MKDKNRVMVAAAEFRFQAGAHLNHKDKALIVLSNGKWHTGIELANRVGWRFGGTLFDLKQEGVDWEKKFENHVWNYRLI